MPMVTIPSSFWIDMSRHLLTERRSGHDETPEGMWAWAIAGNRIE
jgi:hypothetical protein